LPLISKSIVDSQMKFDAIESKGTYSDRVVDDSWKEWCIQHIVPHGKAVVDIGCGGGIYSRGFYEIGAKKVIGVDQSRQYIDEAIQASGNYAPVSFCVGSATETGLSSNCADIVFERALIHHLSDKEQIDNASETWRLLRQGGVLVVQDRTFEDVQSLEPTFWIRSTLFEAFPNLIDFERSRRPDRKVYEEILVNIGFTEVQTISYQEVRKRYASFDELKAEIISRKGKSILYELSDGDIAAYCKLLEEKSFTHPLVECDSWTIWLAKK